MRRCASIPRTRSIPEPAGAPIRPGPRADRTVLSPSSLCGHAQQCGSVDPQCCGRSWGFEIDGLAHPCCHRATIPRKVRQIAEQFGYAPRSADSQPAPGADDDDRGHRPRLTGTVMAMLYEGIAQACGRTGRIALVATADERVEGERRASIRPWPSADRHYPGAGLCLQCQGGGRRDIFGRLANRASAPTPISSWTRPSASMPAPMRH
ncbi:hypothetical protein QE385_000268 [Sphingomonas sp. SORGH_AS 950]|nr:hypothetical protein [Sphingomonas sp. SORGH_AS_0950]